MSIPVFLTGILQCSTYVFSTTQLYSFFLRDHPAHVPAFRRPRRHHHGHPHRRRNRILRRRGRAQRIRLAKGKNNLNNTTINTILWQYDCFPGAYEGLKCVRRPPPGEERSLEQLEEAQERQRQRRIAERDFRSQRRTRGQDWRIGAVHSGLISVVSFYDII